MLVTDRPDFGRWVYFALLLSLSSGCCIGRFQRSPHRCSNTGCGSGDARQRRLPCRSGKGNICEPCFHLAPRPLLGSPSIASSEAVRSSASRWMTLLHTGTEDIAEERLWLVRQGRARSLHPVGGRQSGLDTLESTAVSLDGGGDAGVACFARRVMSGLRRFAPRPRTAAR